MVRPAVGAWHYNGHTWSRVSGLAADIDYAYGTARDGMWATGNRRIPGDTLLRYNGTSWQQVTAPALNGLNFGAVRPQPSCGVWVDAVSRTATNDHTFLMHFSRGKWTKVTMPWASIGADWLAPDGTGGLWMPGAVVGGYTPWMIHLTAAGVWSRIALPGRTFMPDIELVPGTTSLWGAASAGANAQIYAYGPER
jgi:hypothetical protein